MKNRVLMVAAVIAAAALSGGATAWVVSQANKNAGHHDRTSQTIVDSGFEDAGAHFTSYTPQQYPDLTYAAENAVKTVVSVIKTEEIRQQSFGWQDTEEVRYREHESGGSGVIVSPDGYIITNHHVVENASKLTVKLPSGKTYDAKLIGTDADTEIALIKIDETGLPSIPFGSSEALRLGEWVLAIGNPYDLHSTVTVGIVSAKGRSLGAIRTPSNMNFSSQTSAGIESFIQTDAAVNPGNSGGALVNTKGELVGINTLILSRTGSYAGYSFAVPETIVRKVVADMREFGVVQRAFIGIIYTPIDDRFVKEEGEELGVTETGGLYVREVAKDGAAETAGIRVGDVITGIDGEALAGIADVAEIIGLKRPGDTVKITAKRGGNVKQFDVVLRNRAGKSELVARETFSAIESLGGEFSDVRLSDKQKKNLGIKGGIRVTTISRNGILARAKVQQGYIITHINGKAISSVGDLYRITARITSIEGIYPNGRSVTYSLVE